MDDDKGILKFVRDSFAKVAAEAPIPDLRRDRDGWYRRRGWAGPLEELLGHC